MARAVKEQPAANPDPEPPAAEPKGLTLTADVSGLTFKQWRIIRAMTTPGEGYNKFEAMDLMYKVFGDQLDDLPMDDNWTPVLLALIDALNGDAKN